MAGVREDYTITTLNALLSWTRWRSGPSVLLFVNFLVYRVLERFGREATNSVVHVSNSRREPVVGVAFVHRARIACTVRVSHC